MSHSIPEFDFQNYNPRDPWSFPPARLKRFCFETLAILRAPRAKYAIAYPFPDVRFCVFHELYGEVYATGVMALMLEENVLDPSWWQSQPEVGKALPKEVIQSNHATVRGFILSGLLHGILRHTEQLFRQLLQALDPESIAIEKLGNRQVWRQLLQNTQLKDREPLLYLLLTLRDSTGTGGKFCPGNQKDFKVTYRGRKYVFKNGEHVEGYDFGFIDTWDWLLYMIRELVDLIHALVSSPMVAAIPVIKSRYA